MSNFTDKMAPYAKRVKEEIGQPISLTLASWALESGYGTSKIAVGINNYAGIKYSKYSKVATKDTTIYPNMGYASYRSIDDFVTDYIRVMSLSYYDKVRQAYATDGVEDDVYALNASPYAEDQNYGKKLIDILDSNNDGKINNLDDLIKLETNYIPTQQGDSIIDAGLKNFTEKELIAIGGVVAGLFLLLKK